MESFGPEWVEDVMGAIAAVRPREREYRNPYNRIYEAVARCRDRAQAEQLVRAVLDLRLDGQDAAKDEIARLRAALDIADSAVECNCVHHPKKDRHKSGEPCPVMARYRALRGEEE